jgi:hypothetical protein
MRSGRDAVRQKHKYNKKKRNRKREGDALVLEGAHGEGRHVDADGVLIEGGDDRPHLEEVRVVADLHTSTTQRCESKWDNPGGEEERMELEGRTFRSCMRTLTMPRKLPDSRVSRVEAAFMNSS